MRTPCKTYFDTFLKFSLIAVKFSFLIRPLFEVYDENVVTTSAEVFCQSVLTWLQQQCSLVALRPGGVASYRFPHLT